MTDKSPDNPAEFLSLVETIQMEVVLNVLSQLNWNLTELEDMLLIIRDHGKVNDEFSYRKFRNQHARVVQSLDEFSHMVKVIFPALIDTRYQPPESAPVESDTGIDDIPF